MYINRVLRPLTRLIGRRAPAWQRYLGAALATGLTLWLTAALAPVVGGYYLPTAMAVIVMSGMFGGLGPALFAVLLVTIVATGWFYPPRGAFFFQEPEDFFRMLEFLLVACLLALFGALLRRAVAQMQLSAKVSEDAHRRERLRAEQQAAAADLGLLALSTEAPEQVLDAVAAAAARALAVPLSLVAQLDEHTDELRQVAGAGWRDNNRHWQAGPSTPVGYAAATRRPVVVADISRKSHFRLPEEVLAEGVASVAAVAIYAPAEHGHVHGTLAVHDVVPRDFSRGEVQFLQQLANIAAVALERHQAREALTAKEAELHTAQRRLAEDLARWEAVVESISDGLIVLDAEMRPITANAAALRMHGVAPGELDGRSAGGFAELFTVYSPDGQELAPEQWPLTRLLQGEAIEDVELLVRRRDSGNTAIVSYSGRPVPAPDGRTRYYVLTARDLTLTRRQEEDQRFLASASALLSASLDHAEVLERLAQVAVPWFADWCAIDALESDGSVSLRAVAHADPEKTALARELRERYPVRLGAEHGVGRVLRTGEPEFVSEIPDELFARIARDAHHLALMRGLGLRSAMVVPLKARGRILGALTLIFSESGRRYQAQDLRTAEDLAHRAALALDNAHLYEQAQQAASLRDHLMAVVSHDLRNALGAVHINAELLQRLRGAEVAERERRSLDAVLTATRRMERLITDLLDVSVIQSGQLSVALAPHPAAELLREALAQHESLASHQGVRLVLEEAVEQPVCCDAHRISQVLANLISNALKFTPSGGAIRLAAHPVAAGVCFTVADSGPGIEPEAQQRVFEPYWTSGEGARRGTGLGLFISRGIIETHGGQIWLESSPGTGSRFHFTLPLADAAAGSR